jgi:tagaturonate reductase
MLRKLNRTTTDQKKIRPIKVLQFGDGNFLRGFADWVIDILNEKTDFNGDIQIIRPLRKDRFKTIDEQDGLYHVQVRGLRNGKIVSENRLITCVAGAINPYTEFQPFLKSAENPDLQFVISNTTEAGLVFNSSDNNPDELPESFPAKLTLLLFRRFTVFHGDPEKGLVLMPCELIDKNGDVLKKILLQYCSVWKLPDAFIQWLNHHNTFCNSLVDRIVPGFPKETMAELQEATGFEDHRAVAAEPFFLWVIEAPAFVQQEFPAEKAGLSVKYVTDLAPYAIRKVRILNGAHTALVPVAYLRGIKTVRESVEDPFAGDFIRKAIYEEIIPTLDLPVEELRQFAGDVLERFQNPFIRHELKSIAMNSISKFRIRVLPTIKEYHKRSGKLPKRLVYSLAALIRFYKGDWNGELLPVNDSSEIVETFKEIWNNHPAEAVPQLVLSSTTIWGEDLSRIEGLLERVKTSLQEIETMKS